MPQFAHLQVISSQWMPFALYGLRRYFDTRRRAPNRSAGAGLALVAQNLSCGYFLMFFAPCVVAYVLFEVASRRLWTDWRMWIALGVTAIGVALVTLPFLLPYLELRRLGFPPRSLAEVESYAADVYSYWTSPAESRLWGRAIRAFPKAEGDLFPSLTALVLAAIGMAAGVRGAWRRSSGPAAAHPIFSVLVYVVAAGAALYALFLVIILSGHGFADIGPLQISVKSLVRNFQILLVALAVLLATSPRARSFAAHWAGSVAGIAVLLVLLTFLLSLGPEIKTMGRLASRHGAVRVLLLARARLRRPSRAGPLRHADDGVPVDRGRASARSTRNERESFRAAARLHRRRPIGLFAVAESIAAPIVLNGTGPEADYATPPSHMFTGDQVPPVYRFLKTLPPETVVAEFPLGQWTYELRYMFYSTAHWHPLDQRLQRHVSAQLRHARGRPSPARRSSRRSLGRAGHLGRHARGGARKLLQGRTRQGRQSVADRPRCAARRRISTEDKVFPCMPAKQPHSKPPTFGNPAPHMVSVRRHVVLALRPA